MPQLGLGDVARELEAHPARRGALPQHLDVGVVARRTRPDRAHQGPPRHGVDHILDALAGMHEAQNPHDPAIAGGRGAPDAHRRAQADDRVPRGAQVLRRLPRAQGHRPDHPRGRVLLAARAVGLRQDHAAQNHRRVRGHLVRGGADRRQGHGGRARQRPADEHGVPVLRHLPACRPPSRGAARNLPPADGVTGPGGVIMRKIITLALLGLTALSGPAWSQANIKPDPDPRVPPQQGQSLPREDALFLRQATAASQGQVELGRLAAEKAPDGELRSLAQRIAETHVKLTDDLTRLTDTRTLPPADQLQPERTDAFGAAGAVSNPENAREGMAQEAVQSLSGVSGDAFGKAYVEAQLRLHDRLVDRGDAFAMHGVDRDGRVERERSQDRGLLRRIEALHIAGRVGLRVPEALRIREHGVELAALAVHAVEDVVGRAVDDAHDPHDAVARERVPHGAHDRDGPGHRGLVGQLGARGTRVVLQLPSGLREQRLVARDHGLARVQSAQHARAGGLDPARELHDDVRGVDHRVRVRGQQLRGQLRVPRGLRIAHGHAAQFQAHAAAQGQLAPTREQDVGHLGAHGARAEQADLQDGSLVGGRRSGGHGSCAPPWSHGCR